MSTQPTGMGTARAQAEAIRRLRGGPEPVATPTMDGARAYPGLVTRTIALAIDAIVVNGSTALVAVTVGLALGLLHLPAEVDRVLVAILAGLGVLWSVAYFVFFWSTTGQTPGSRVMSISVVDAHARGALKPRRALLRFIALCIGAIALLSGLLIMLWDERRRCFQDRLARTVVVYVPEDPR